MYAYFFLHIYAPFLKLKNIISTFSTPSQLLWKELSKKLLIIIRLCSSYVECILLLFIRDPTCLSYCCISQNYNVTPHNLIKCNIIDAKHNGNGKLWLNVCAPWRKQWSKLDHAFIWFVIQSKKKLHFFQENIGLPSVTPSLSNNNDTCNSFISCVPMLHLDRPGSSSR